MALHFAILSPQAEVAVGEARMLTASGTEGLFGVLENHAPFASLLRPGLLRLELLDGSRQDFYVRSGFARASADQVVVLADEIIAKDDLDEATLRKALSDRQDDVASMLDEEKRKDAAQALKEIQAQLNVLGQVG